MHQNNGSSNPLGFAVIDLETTGLDKLNNDRVIEIAVVLLDTNGEITETYDTLINPQRDLGPTSMHKINGSMVVNAPLFKEILYTLTEKLKGRKLIAHNAVFENRFFIKEYEKAGIEFNISTDYWLDTFTMSSDFFPGLVDYKLNTLTDFLDIDLTNAHTALSDALATAKLFKLIFDKNSAIFYKHSQKALTYQWPIINNGSSKEWYPRSSIEINKKLNYQDVFLPNIFSSCFNSIDLSREITKQEYFDKLCSSFLGNDLISFDVSSLHSIVKNARFSQKVFMELNEKYFSLLAKSDRFANMNYKQKAIRLREIGVILGIDDDVLFRTIHSKNSINYQHDEQNPVFCLKQKDRITFTGETFLFTRDDWDYNLLSLGYELKDLTKSTRLLVSNDISSLSSKAVKARKYGIIIINEKTLADMIGISVP